MIKTPEVLKASNDWSSKLVTLISRNRLLLVISPGRRVRWVLRGWRQCRRRTWSRASSRRRSPRHWSSRSCAGKYKEHFQPSVLWHNGKSAWFKQKYILSWILNQLKTLLLVTCPSFGCLIGQFWPLVEHPLIELSHLMATFSFVTFEKISILKPYNEKLPTPHLNFGNEWRPVVFSLFVNTLLI